MAPITDILPSFGEVKTPVANSTVAMGRLAWLGRRARSSIVKVSNLVSYGIARYLLYLFRIPSRAMIKL